MENNNVLTGADFDGVFRFSNNSDEDFIALWNNREYKFPAKTRSPMIILGESPENVQEIRKRFAYRWAEREWYKGDEYKRMKEMGNGLPPTRDDRMLEPLIQMCLSPLPESKAEIKEVPKKEIKTRATKAVGKDDNLNQAFSEETREGNIQVLGVQPDRA